MVRQVVGSQHGLEVVGANFPPKGTLGTILGPFVVDAIDMVTVAAMDDATEAGRRTEAVFLDVLALDGLCLLYTSDAADE